MNCSECKGDVTCLAISQKQRPFRRNAVETNATALAFQESLSRDHISSGSRQRHQGGALKFKPHEVTRACWIHWGAMET